MIKFVKATKKIHTPFWLVLLLVLIVFMFGFLIGSTKVMADFLPSSVSATLYAHAPKGIDLNPVWKVWYLLDNEFVDAHYEEKKNGTTTEKELSEDEKKQNRIWGMARGIAASTNDPYTVFLPPSDKELFTDDIKGEFQGVGMEISVRDGVLTVVSPLKGTPAFKAGIKAKDRVLEIDAKNTKGMGVMDAVKLIRGKKGTKVKLKIFREGEGIKEIDVTRAVIKVPTLKTSMLPTGEFVIELLQFSEPSPDLFRKALIEFDHAHTDNLIIDLRGNPGGYLGAAVNMASWFLPEGEVVVTEDYGKGKKQVVHRSQGMNVFTNKLKLVILVDKGSASASEILAGALHEHGKATLIGTNTFGKGSVQKLISITDDTSLKMTIARWLLPGGVHINKDGIEPDIKIDFKKLIEERDGKKFGEDEDPIMDRALKFYKTGK